MHDALRERSLNVIETKLSPDRKIYLAVEAPSRGWYLGSKDRAQN
jgi:hypothetical protein